MTGIQRGFHCAFAIVDGTWVEDVRIAAVGDRITSIATGEAAWPDDVMLGAVIPGFANAHSHAFHRQLRGRTHDDGGDFWQWRRRMYDTAGELTPDGYFGIAERVFSEMRDTGYTAVGEFHYVHHQPDGSQYPDHAMELSLAAAAASAGIRMVLLDTCYLQGGIDQPLNVEQRRFGDGDARRWIERWHALRDALASTAGDLVTLGAAVHSVRAVARRDLAVVAEGLPRDVPLHAHVSEQPAENQACLDKYGLTPVGLFAEQGLVSPQFSAVHATHLTDADISILGDAGATVVMCPTTEADLGDGIGPAPELHAAGVRLAIGSDQHVVIDPFEEISRLELDQRLRLQRRGVFDLAQLWKAGTIGGYDSLGLSQGGKGLGFAVGDLWDAVEVDLESPRTRGTDKWQLPLTARGGDVRATIVGGRVTRPAT